jgi:hypothetical protein
MYMCGRSAFALLPAMPADNFLANSDGPPSARTRLGSVLCGRGLRGALAWQKTDPASFHSEPGSRLSYDSDEEGSGHETEESADETG